MSLLEPCDRGFEHWLHHELCGFEAATSLSFSFLVCEILNSNPSCNCEGQMADTKRQYCNGYTVGVKRMLVFDSRSIEMQWEMLKEAKCG